MSTSRFDLDMMTIALRMARRGLGRTAPNPAVGAVIADEASGEVIARGWTQPGGRPHAETEAIRRAGASARGKTMYVTLEPCAHHGKTPPCADAIVAAGLKRVAIGAGDPDPRTAGQGIAKLRAAGVQVTEGVLQAEARFLTLGHILRVTENRPFVQIKMALDREGCVPYGSKGSPRIVTGELSRARGHLMRAEADAILVGAGTVRDDDPDLTCRLPGLAAQSPIRVVLASDARGFSSTRLARSARRVPVWLFCGPETTAESLNGIEALGVRVFREAQVAGKIAILSVLRTLAAEGITRLLVEGGPRAWKAFAAAGLADEAIVFQAPPQGFIASDTWAEDSVRNACRHYLPGLGLDIVAARRCDGDTEVRLIRTRKV